MNLLYADQAGNVFDHPKYDTLGRHGDLLSEITEEEWIPLPDGATLVSMPDTRPIGIRRDNGEMEKLPGDYCAVGALLPQGFTRLQLPGYIKSDKSKVLPLFGYTAAAWKDGKFYAAAARTDDPKPWNPLLCDPLELKRQVDRKLEEHPNNRVISHLSHCALEYECLTAANTFLQRYEGAVPVSFACNAGCFGCLSEQPKDSGFPAPQTRMNFQPQLDDVVEIMLDHLQAGPDNIISFGQGCEGEPSTQAKLIIEAIRRVRALTNQGWININTNAGLTDHIRGIVDAGLNLMRISIISALDAHYNAYYKPRGYNLANVEKSMRYAADKGVYTSINYLIFPGVTDREEELEAMIELARRTDLKLIQLRNLNIDPESYLQLIPPPQGERFGMMQAIEILREELPGVTIGSYTHIPQLHS